MQPLDGVRVLDLTRVLAGPYCTMLMSDMGAEVTKVESLSGDSTRAWSASDDKPVAFHNVNRGKSSIAIDFRTSRGKQLLVDLAQECDVLVENFRPGTKEKLGISYGDLNANHPSLVYCSISGFGQTGPDRGRGGYDLIAQAASGIMSVTGLDGSAEPVKCGIPIADLSAGLFSLIGILGALRRASQTGHGEHLDVSLVESAAALTVWETSEYWLTGATPGPTGSAHRLSAPYQAFETADRPIVIAANTDNQFRALLEVLDITDLEADRRFMNVRSRTTNRRELAAILQPCFRKRSAQQWQEELDRAGVAASIVRTIPEMLQDPHLIDREATGSIEDQDGASIPIIYSPIARQFANEVVAKPGPKHGEQSKEVLSNLLRLSDPEIEKLVDDGIVASGRVL